MNSTAAAALKALDNALAQVGRTIVLRRAATGPDAALTPFECECKAMVSVSQPSDVADITHRAGDAPDTQIILSPTELARRQWPGPGLKPVPRRDDRVLIDDDVLIVDTVLSRDVGGTIVRIELQCRAESAG